MAQEVLARRRAGLDEGDALLVEAEEVVAAVGG